VAGKSYSNLDVHITPAAEGFRAWLDSSVGGQASVDFAEPFSDDELRAIQARLAGDVATFQSAFNSAGGSDLDAIKAVGDRLFSAIFQGPARICLSNGLLEAEQRGSGLRIRLHLGQVPKLAELPWEYLYDPYFDRFLSSSDQTPVVRWTDLPEARRPLQVTPPLRILVVIASPTEYPPLDVDQEWSRLRDALSELEQRGLVLLDRLEGATLGALQQRLRQGELHILHFVGHGSFDPQTQRGTVVFEDEAGHGQPVDGDRLGELLRDRLLRLVILNACEGARGSPVTPWAGLAQQLGRKGIPATIAMQFPITDRAALCFSQEFYRALADGLPVDAALTEARRAILSRENELEWGTPALYLGATDGEVFDVTPLSPQQQRQNQKLALSHEARVAIAQGNWEAAVSKLEALLALDPADVRAGADLQRARRYLLVPTLFAEGRAHFDAGRWREALDGLRQVQIIAGDYRGVYGLMARAQHELLQLERRQDNDQSTVPTGLGPSDGVYQRIVEHMRDGKLVPFLGPDVNLCCRPPGLLWQRDQRQYLPSSEELAEYLATRVGYPGSDTHDLGRVAQYAAAALGSAELRDELRALYGSSYPPGSVHQLFAGLPALLRARNHPPRPQLIVTANHDDVLERAFDDVGEPYDLVAYVPDEEQGRFWHWPAGAEAKAIAVPNEYTDLPIEQRTVILKIHGAVDPPSLEQGSCLITEDQYIDYSSRIAGLLPPALVRKLVRSHFLFLGYRVRDWNLRIFLRSFWSLWRRGDYRAWAVRLNPGQPDDTLWQRLDVDVLGVGLDDFVAMLSERMQTLTSVGGGSE
jgi:tetratricopeptide (TPR) repeat protein